MTTSNLLLILLIVLVSIFLRQIEGFKSEERKDDLESENKSGRNGKSKKNNVS